MFLYLLYSPAHSTLLNIRDVKVGDIGDAFILGTYTLLRVLAALLIGALWTIPVGVAIGLRPKLSGEIAAGHTNHCFFSGQYDFSFRNYFIFKI